MASPTNLTESISKLREREGGFLPDNSSRPPFRANSIGKSQIKERKFATDYFMLFAYGLFATALTAQMILIVWLDLL